MSIIHVLVNLCLKLAFYFEGCDCTYDCSLQMFSLAHFLIDQIPRVYVHLISSKHYHHLYKELIQRLVLLVASH